MNGRSQRSGIAVIAVTRQGTLLAGEIAAILAESDPDADISVHVKADWQDDAPEDAVPFEGSLKSRVAELFPSVETMIFVLAVGAAVRLVAPLLGRKQADPGVICIDDAGQFVIPVLGGHQAAANDLAALLADALDSTPVITTASDGAGLPNLDRLGADLKWRVDASPDTLKQASAALLAGEQPIVYTQPGLPAVAPIPNLWPRTRSLEHLRGWAGPRIAVTDRLIDATTQQDGGPLVVYRPPTLVLGVGCSTDAPPDEVLTLARDTLAEAGLAWGSVQTVATIDRRLTHPALLKLVWETDASFFPVYTSEELAAVTDVPNGSAEVERHVGTPGVCEPAAILASDGGQLLVPKRKSAHATVAVATRAPSPTSSGKLWLIGMGPGPVDLMTGRAQAALTSADAVVGYRGYLELLDGLVPARAMRAYELGEERERAAEALKLAAGGASVALVSSGDIGVYGMAGLVYELLHEQADQEAADLDIEMVPGVTAASAANALLGAPLMLDFAAISLSDLLVPWEMIRQRLAAAAQGDLVVVLYNPASARRRQPFEDALTILREHRPPETPVGLVRDAYRSEQAVTVTTLGDLAVDQVDMRTVVIVGCSRTAVLDGRLVTRRGYLDGGHG